MNIFQVVINNLRQEATTYRYPDRVAIPDHFRGLVQLDTELCVGCSTCAYVCPSNAIEVTAGKSDYSWNYEPGRCTFCGRCLDVCPTQALSMEIDCPPVYLQSGELQKAYQLEYPLCPQCHRPAHPINNMLLVSVFGEISEEVRVWSQLCERCRQKYQQSQFFEAGGFRSEL